MSLPPDDDATRIDQALQQWRQGDVALEETWFVHLANPACPLTPESAAAEGDGLTAIDAEVDGLVVLTQTCDVVRSCTERPFIDVAPLVEVSQEVLDQIKKGRRPGYAFVPALESRRLVADLDRVMTVEKSLVASWMRTPGWTVDAEVRDFARALDRKRTRFAFPDDFNAMVKKLQDRLQEKHDKESPEGRSLRALREVRVKASPSWDDANAKLTMWFIREGDDLAFDGSDWSKHLDAWQKLLQPSARFTIEAAAVVGLEDITAKDYVESDRLDLDHLSGDGTCG